jgi:hypothetical protein
VELGLGCDRLPPVGPAAHLTGLRAGPMSRREAFPMLRGWWEHRAGGQGRGGHVGNAEGALERARCVHEEKASAGTREAGCGGPQCIDEGGQIRDMDRVEIDDHHVGGG